MVPLEELLRHSDFISLHAPLTDSTHGLFGDRQFEQMKPTAFLINTSRGGLIDHAALWRAISSGRLAGAGLDVFDPEPPDLSLPLFRDDRVIVTPHAAFTSEESLQDLRNARGPSDRRGLAGPTTGKCGQSASLQPPGLIASRSYLCHSRRGSPVPPAL